MRSKTKIALAFASFLAGTSLALAQTATITIGDDVRTEFRTYVTTEQVAPVEVEDVEIAVGTTLPETVVLQPVPDVIVTEAPELEGHRYVLVDNRIVVVEPSTTRIVAVIEE